MKIVFLTGAGVSKESGIDTYRDKEDGIWNRYDPKDVATLQGWKKDREHVIDFFTLVYKDLKTKKPNLAHNVIAELEEEHEVTILTQNIDTLHEQAGSTNVLHLHGKYDEVKSTVKPKHTYTLQEVGCEEYIKIGSKCEFGSQLRPNVVFFGEMPNYMDEASKKIMEADLLVVIGTSFEVNTARILFDIASCEKIIIDPNINEDIIEKFDKAFIKPATEGIIELKHYIHGNKTLS